MKYRKYILLFLFIAFCLTDCKKYPEGPRISLTSKVKRVLGNYRVESFLIDGADSTSQLTCLKYSFYRSKEHQLLKSLECTGVGIGEADWKFENHHKELYISVELGKMSKTPFPGNACMQLCSVLSWEIQRLTEKEMWLKVESGGREYYVKFKRIYNVI
jgi:hypothetical protein